MHSSSKFARILLRGCCHHHRHHHHQWLPCQRPAAAGRSSSLTMLASSSSPRGSSVTVNDDVNHARADRLDRRGRRRHDDNNDDDIIDDDDCVISSQRRWILSHLNQRCYQHHHQQQQRLRRSTDKRNGLTPSSPWSRSVPTWEAATATTMAMIQRQTHPSSLSPTRVSATATVRWMSTTSKDQKETQTRLDDEDRSTDSKRQGAEMSEEWIPPPRRIFEEGDDDDDGLESDGVRNPYNDDLSQQQQRSYKHQQRIDALYRRQEDALLQLSEEEMETMSEDEILERVERVLAMEDALEEASFWQELQREEEREEKRKQSQRQQAAAATTTDWLQTRRAALGVEKASSSVVPVVPHQLLTLEEIQTLLESLGGSNLAVLMDDADYPRMGGAQGMIVCTAGGSINHHDTAAVNPFAINALTRNLIDHLKDRRLDELGVLGAQMGTNHLTPRGTARTPRSRQSTWHVVDCGNFVVHILDAYTRDHLKLEDLWSGKDPLWRLEYWNEDAVEEYCGRHPVPASYNGGNGSAAAAESSSGSFLWDPSMVRRLERNQYSSSPFPSHRPVISTVTKRRDRRAGRRKRREQRQLQHRQQGRY